MYRVSAGVAALLSLVGCGLVDPDIADFPLRFPSQSVAVESADWELTDDDEIPQLECGDVPGVCADAVREYCGEEEVCFGSCDGAYCEAAVVMSLWHTIDLEAENHDEFQRIENQPVVSVDVDDVTYTVEENTFNVPMPELGIYAAPRTVMEHGSPEAELIGTISPLGEGERVEDRPITFAEEGRERLEAFLGDYRNPFNIIVGGQLDLSAGDTVPDGRLRAVVDVQATARP